MEYQLNIDWSHFLTHYWQKKPVILRNAISNFVDPITPDELAGLALEDEIESRLVTNKKGKWDAKYGPFEHYNDFGETNWSLLVQAVDHWHDEAAKLVAPFRCIPQWLFDDLMISYAVPQGGVGPHIDQYDVFIIQGMGRRRWRVGDINPDYKQFCAHPALLHVESFMPIIDEEITAGDILYIPPGFPHDGVCIEESLSYSVGFRAPTAQGMLSSFTDYVLEHDMGAKHYANPELQLPENSLLVQPSELQKLKMMMSDLINNEQLFEAWFGRFITQSNHDLNIIAVEPEYTVEDVIEQFMAGESCQRVNSIRLLQVGEHCFIHGERVELPKVLTDVLCQQEVIDQDLLKHYFHDRTVMIEFTGLMNKGYWYFIE